jgi:membrane dipeptidase
MKKSAPLLAFLLPAILCCAQGDNPDYRKVHFGALFVDTHNDVVQRVLAGEDLSKRTTHGHSDLPRFIEGGVDVELFSIWVPPEKTGRGYFEQAVEQMDSIDALARRNPDRMAMGNSADDIDSLVAAGKFVGLYGVEGGHAIENDLSKLDYFYSRGARYMTLTWNNSTDWATSASDETDPANPPAHPGLSDFGRQVVRRMNDLGMLVDISHVGERTFRDVMGATRKPVIASHSSVWNISPHRRNLKDGQLKAIRDNGGVVFINFAPWFIDSTFGRREAAMRKSRARRIDSIQATIRGDEFIKDLYSSEQLSAEYDTIRPTLSQVLDHFDYVARLIGVDHVGVGSDFDGITVAPAGLDDVTRFPELTKGLLERGYSVRDVEKILGGNFMRVLRAAENR